MLSPITGTAAGVQRHGRGRRERPAAGSLHRGRVDAALQRREVEPTVPVDDKLAVYLGFLSFGSR